jgi:Icc-related predicted phosphoesterase
MKITFISDTHMHKPSVNSFTEGKDMVVHAGDLTYRGTSREIEEALNWFSELDFTHKILVPGNHDFLFEVDFNKVLTMCESRGITVLIDSMIEVEGIKIWGSPITPWFHNWAFNRYRGSEIQAHWDKIPDGIDILVTHGPPAYIGSLCKTEEGEDVGCEDLYRAVQRVKPKYHVFGHIHEGFGMKEIDGITYINASYLNRAYRPVNFPIEIDYAK